jgi:hypothetical protein
MNHCDMILVMMAAINMAKALKTVFIIFSPWIDKRLGYI